MKNKPAAAVDRSAAVPLYHQIFLQVRDEILSGQRPFGSAVATEMELSDRYRVSRITVRRALDELAQHHFVERKRRVGTTVIFRPPEKPFEANIDQAVDSLLELGRMTKVRVLDIQTEGAAPGIAEVMNLQPGEPLVRARRVRYLDGEPLGYVVSYVPAAMKSHMTRARLSSLPILQLVKMAGFQLGKATQTIAAMLADPSICRALSVEPRAAILRVSRTVYDPAGNPILLTIAHYRSDRYQLRMDFQH